MQLKDGKPAGVHKLIDALRPITTRLFHLNAAQRAQEAHDLKFTAMPLTLAQANTFIAAFHRHHKPAQGHRFSIGVLDKERTIVGVAIVGRPVARGCDPYYTAEVTRLCTNGEKNACSFLYAACARICKEMGFTKIQTYILDSEPGVTLTAAGWQHEADTAGGDWNHSKVNKGTRRTDQPMQAKQRWAKTLQ